MESLQRMARRNKRSLESSEGCWVKMEFEQWGKKHQADLCGVRPHKFKYLHFQQADKPSQCRTSEPAPNPRCLMLSPRRETSHALKQLNTCHLATFLVHIYWDQTVTSLVNTLWNNSLHGGGPAGVLDGAGARWARQWTDSTCFPMLWKWTESVQRENNTDERPICTYTTTIARSLHPTFNPF